MALRYVRLVEVAQGWQDWVHRVNFHGWTPPASFHPRAPGEASSLTPVVLGRWLPTCLALDTQYIFEFSISPPDTDTSSNGVDCFTRQCRALYCKLTVSETGIVLVSPHFHARRDSKGGITWRTQITLSIASSYPSSERSSHICTTRRLSGSVNALTGGDFVAECRRIVQEDRPVTLRWELCSKNSNISYIALWECSSVRFESPRALELAGRRNAVQTLPVDEKLSVSGSAPHICGCPCEIEDLINKPHTFDISTPKTAREWLRYVQVLLCQDFDALEKSEQIDMLKNFVESLTKETAATEVVPRSPNSKALD